MAVTYRTEELALGSIRENPANDFDMDEAGIARLADSIERDGLGQLPLGRRMPDGSVMLIAGHRRLAAFRLLRDRDSERWAKMPVNVADGLSEAQAAALVQVTNLETRQLSREERARRYLELSRLLPQLRHEREDLRGLREAEAVARVINEGTSEGAHVTASVVRRAIAWQRGRDEAVGEAERLSGRMAAGWREEARAGHVAPEAIRKVAELPESAQDEVLVDWQRRGGRTKDLADAIAAHQPVTSSAARGAAERAIAAMGKATLEVRRGAVLSPGLMRRLASAHRTLQDVVREREQAKAPSDDPDSLI